MDAKAPTSHASSSSTYGLGTTSNYGHVKTINGLTQSSHSNGTALSAYQGKVLKDAIDAKPDSSDIPTKITDLTNDSDFIEKSATSGLVKNDGTIDTTSYSTFDGNYNNLSNKPTIPSASTATPSADTSSGSYGSGTSYARSNHTHPKSSLYAEATHNHTKSQITDFPSIPSKTSDLTNDGDGTNAFLTQHQSLSNYVQKSSTTGLLKNDGTVDTTTYLPSSSYVPYYYATCATAAATQDKEVTITDFTLETGVVIVVKFTNANTYNGTARLKINSLTAIDIATVGTTKTSRYHWTAGEAVTFVYDGANFVMINTGIATTSYYGVTKLSSSTSSTSGSLAATPAAVKAAYDLANSKADPSDIPANTSDLTNDSGFITSAAIADMLTSNDIANNLTTTAAGKVLDARQGKALADLIGDAITYINQ